MRVSQNYDAIHEFQLLIKQLVVNGRTSEGLELLQKVYEIVTEDDPIKPEHTGNLDGDIESYTGRVQERQEKIDAELYELMRNYRN